SFRANRHRPVNTPDSGKGVGALVDFQAAPGGEDIQVVRAAGPTPNPVLDAVQHSRALAVEPQPNQTLRQAGEIAAVDIQLVPVAVVEWNFPAVNLHARGSRLPPEPLQDILVLPVFIEVDCAVLVQSVDVRVAGGIPQLHQHDK